MTVVGELYADGPLVAVTWIDCGDTASLARAAAYLHEQGWVQGDTPPAPEDGRRLYVTFWAVPETLDEIADALPAGEGAREMFGDPATDEANARAIRWANAYTFGVVRSALMVSLLDVAGIAARVYAIRVQPVDASFPRAYQYEGIDDDKREAWERTVRG